MSLTVLMIVLTLGADDRLSAAFVETEGMENCLQRADVVRGILAGSTEVETIICRPSAQAFEPFMHGADMDAGLTRHSFLIHEADNRADISRTTACASARPAPATYCATSVQDMLAD